MTEIPVIFKHKSDFPVKNDINTSGPSHPTIFSSAEDFGFTIPLPCKLVVDKLGCKFVGEGFETTLKMVGEDCVIPLGMEVFIPEGVALFNYGVNLMGVKEYIVDRSTHPGNWYTPKLIAKLAPGEYDPKGIYLKILPLLDLHYQFLYKEAKDEGK